MARSQRGRAREDMRIIKNALRMKDLESTDPIYLEHRVNILGQKGAQKIIKPRLDTGRR